MNLGGSNYLVYFTASKMIPKEQTSNSRCIHRKKHENPKDCISKILPLFGHKGTKQKEMLKAQLHRVHISSRVLSWGKSRPSSSKIILNSHSHFNYWCVILDTHYFTFTNLLSSNVGSFRFFLLPWTQKSLPTSRYYQVLKE